MNRSQSDRLALQFGVDAIIDNSERLAAAGIAPSIGIAEDAYD